MKFFTPELLIRANSSDDAESLAAADAWEAAAAEYERAVSKLSETLPTSVRELADLYLHDGELLMWGQPGEHLRSHRRTRLGATAYEPRQSLVVIKLDELITSITYDLSGTVRVSPRRKAKPFAGRRHVDWLYDEVDVSPTVEPAGVGRVLHIDGREMDSSPNNKTAYVHRVLLSDGREVEVPFQSVKVQQFPLSPPSSEQIAPARAQARRSA